MQTGHHTYHIYKVFLQCVCEHASSAHYTLQTWHGTCGIYKVSLQCECEYASSVDHFVQTGSDTYHMYMVSLQCECEYAYSGYNNLCANLAPHLLHLNLFSALSRLPFVTWQLIVATIVSSDVMSLFNSCVSIRIYQYRCSIRPPLPNTSKLK